MEYHNQTYQHHQANNPPMTVLRGNSSNAPGLSLPDASSSSEKALMWSQTQYMSESGYSTQAPSISSIDAFLNNEQMDNTIHSMDQSHSAALSTTSTINIQHQQQQQSSEWNLQQNFKLEPPQPQPAYSQTSAVEMISAQPSHTVQPAQLAVPETDSDNAVANWMNYQDNSEMAMKAIPELLKLLVDEDLVVVQQAAILFNQMSRNEGPRIALIQTNNSIQLLVDCLNTTADLETARCIVGTLYSVSTQKPLGVQAIINSKALEPLVKMMSANLDTIVSYAITTLHNVLLECGDKVKEQLRKMGAIDHMVPLLNKNNNVKFLSIVVDCLQLLAFGNQEAKRIILALGGTQMLVGLLDNTYHKLILNITRLLKVLSACSQNKIALVNFNVMQALSMHLTQSVNSSSSSKDITTNCLLTLRNLSDAATRLNGLEQLVENLINLLASSSDFTLCTLAAGILSNLTCNNENNKKTVLRANGIAVLLRAIQANIHVKPQLVEPCICALRHITNKHQDMLLAQEQVRTINGLPIMLQLLNVTTQPRSWQCIKAALGLTRNFCTNQLNLNQLRTNGVIEKLMQVLYEAYTEIQNKMQNQELASNCTVAKVDDVNLFDIIEMSSSALLILAKEHQDQIIMRDLDCIGFFVQMFYSTNQLIQKASVSILAELASSKECGEVIEQQAGLHQFVQANFCNQYGTLKTIAELTGSNTSSTNTTTISSVILQHVTTLMQRLQDQKNQRAIFMQQQRSLFPPQYQHSAIPQEQQYGGIQMINNNQQPMMYYNSQAVNPMQSVYAPPQQQYPSHQFF